MNAQFDWLIGHEPTITREHELAMKAAETRRDLGMLRAQDKAHRECGDDWTSAAATFLYHYASDIAAGQPFLIEDAREISNQARFALAQPSNPKAWGPAVRYACKKGWIKSAGYAAVRCSNGSPRSLWVLAT